MKLKDPAVVVDAMLDSLDSEPPAIACNWCRAPFNWVEFYEPGIRAKMIDHLLVHHDDQYRQRATTAEEAEQI